MAEDTESRGADATPLGLGALALTTFLLSARNAGFAPDLVWLAPALFCGGLALLVAGFGALRRRDTFGATAYTTYAGFWLSLVGMVALGFLGKVPAEDVSDTLGWFFFAFAVFNAYVMVASARVSLAMFAVFLALEVTEVLLVIGFLTDRATALQLAGYAGIASAVFAWYGAAAALLNSVAGRPMVSAGRPVWSPAAAPDVVEEPPAPPLVSSEPSMPAEAPARRRSTPRRRTPQATTGETPES